MSTPAATNQTKPPPATTTATAKKDSTQAPCDADSKNILQWFSFVMVLLNLIMFAAFINSGCRMQDHRPNRSARVGTRVSADNRAIASFAGYLQIQRQTKDQRVLSNQYLPLKLESLFWTERTDSDHNFTGIDLPNPKRIRLMKLITCCSTLSFTFIENPLKERWQLLSASLIYNLLVEFTSGQLSIECQFGQPGKDFGIGFYRSYQSPANIGYSCKRRDLSADSGGGDLKLHLWIDEFKFELDGDDRLISRNEFSENSTACAA